MKWIAVDKYKPEAFKKVLGYCGGDEVQMIVCDDEGNFIGTDGCVIDFVSHWMKIELPDHDDPCIHCRWYLSWDEAEEKAAKLNETHGDEYTTAEDIMCDNDMEHCCLCPKR